MSSLAPYQFSVDGLPDDFFTVHRLRGREAISEAYRFEIVVTGQPGDDQSVERVALGQSATLVFNVGAARAFTGVVAAIRVFDRRPPDGRSTYEVALVPKLWLLKRKRTTRIFQNMRVPDIATKVLLEGGISARWQLARAYPVREYCTQYEESDYAFVRRILAEAGICFYFAQGGPVSDTDMAVGDVVAAAGSAASSAVSSFAGSAAGALVSDVASAATPLIPGDTVIGTDDATFYPPLGADDAAALEAETAVGDVAEVGAAIGGLGSVGGAALGAAGAVAGEVIGAVTSRPARTLYYLDVISAGVPTASSSERITKFVLRNTVRANSAMFRDYDPERPLARPESVALSNDPFPSSGLEQAAEVATEAGSALGQIAPGPVGAFGDAVAENAGAVATGIEDVLGDHPPPLLADYEHHGQFLFPKWSFAGDEAARMLRQRRRRASIARGESSSADLGAAHRFSLSDHPVARVDGEYVLTRVEHRGVATPTQAGEAVYANTFECAPATMTYVPPRPKRKSVQVSLTARVVGPPGTEIHVDRMGQIKVEFHWDRDGKGDDRSSCWIRTMHAWAGAGWGAQFIPRVGMEVVVVFEGGDPDKPMVIGCLYNGTHPSPFQLPSDRTRSGFRSQSSPGGGGYNELSFEDRKDGEQLYIRAERDLDEVVGRNQHTTITSKKETTVGSNRSATVGGDDLLEVSGNQATGVRGSKGLQVDGDHSIAVGTEKKEASLAIWSWGDADLGAKGGLVLRSEYGITLQCGQSSIRIDKDEVVIDAPTVRLSGKKKVTASGNGPSLVLGDDAELMSKTIRLFSKGASVELADDARVDGSSILLNCKGNKPSTDDDEAAAAPTKPFSLKLTDGTFQPYAGKSYVLLAGGSKYEGTTDGSGTLNEQVPAGATAAELMVWTGERPEGPKLRYHVRITDVPDASTVAGARARLTNLGYRPGAVGDEIDDALRTALEDFQLDHDLERTGLLDGPTIAKLCEIHGH